MEICHGAPFDEDHYIFDGVDAQRALDTRSRQVCLFGHTHLPVMFMANGLDPGRPTFRTTSCRRCRSRMAPAI